MFPTHKTLFAMEDRVMKMPGLYVMSFCCYIAALSALGTDTTTGPSRDFLLATTALSTLYWGVSSANSIYGNGKPSSLLMIAGPVHQFTFWLLLAYYRGDVYGKQPAGVLNAVHTAMVGLFNLDLIVKTWLLAVNPNKYLEYVNEKTDQPLEVEST
tara:strand:+ start:198 stop:665 length:468 start_codon:yes stop_codon:yes gene_type:complete